MPETAVNAARVPLDSAAIAAEIFALVGTGRQVAPYSARYEGLDLAAAYRVAADVHARRIARGERPVGRKIGFTNRTIWAEYDVWAPIWGYMYDSTVRDLASASEGLSLAGLAEPRIEPEIVFGLAAPPAQGMDDVTLLHCIDWVAHGFEIVQSLFPAWKFAAADTVAAYGLHGRLLIGERRPVAPQRDRWLATLASFEIELACDGEVRDRGRAANVLDGPLFALRHLVEVLAGDPAMPPLAAGEIVTTGTLTRALPVAAGQTWTTALRGVDLPGNRLRFV
jgi:2-oxo-3-hexenedioate decarboxylase